MQTSLITGPERRRSWSEDQKLALLAAAFSPGAKVAEVARRADICTSLIYRWRRDFAAATPTGFLPALLSDDRAPGGEAVAPKPGIVVELPGDRRVKIDAGADLALVTAVLRALR
ncbi:IS66-like element accessory protein TnpA [Phenylobacterium sp.]|uniref:IS66-like element accessory protein TnpA n=1 Tax=Phenylobacterium sp. TaxID=1871053 RepID=UPI00374DF82A